MINSYLITNPYRDQNEMTINLTCNLLVHHFPIKITNLDHIIVILVIFNIKLFCVVLFEWQYCI